MIPVLRVVIRKHDGGVISVVSTQGAGIKYHDPHDEHISIYMDFQANKLYEERLGVIMHYLSMQK